ncbi:hypothetical protein EDB85DRAFT_2288509 [Lactarius pseudohatsudake]|nr:hypothetical protein EDB85DRAFT_2288509 [Lactarius pseudohatsudake]
MFTRTIEVDGFGELNVHDVHQKSTAKGAIPLLFPPPLPPPLPPEPLLNRTRAQGQEASSNLPGYAWSEAALEKGFNTNHYAELFDKLMISPGYTEYVAKTGGMY